MTTARGNQLNRSEGCDNVSLGGGTIPRGGHGRRLGYHPPNPLKAAPGHHVVAAHPGGGDRDLEMVCSVALDVVGGRPRAAGPRIGG